MWDVLEWIDIFYLDLIVKFGGYVMVVGLIIY